jgi:hypothetical protein
LTSVTQVASASLMIVTRPDFPADNVKELVAAAKADPGKIVFASPGFAATQHFAAELFKQIAGVNLLHVPFRSSPEAINAVLGKHADVLFDTVSALIGQVQSGSLKALPASCRAMTSPLGMACLGPRACRGLYGRRVREIHGGRIQAVERRSRGRGHFAAVGGVRALSF